MHGHKKKIMRCDGCYTIKEVCDLHVVGEDAVIDCPCRKCLVKMVCDDACEPYAKHIAVTYKEYNKTIDKGELCKNKK